MTLVILTTLHICAVFIGTKMAQLENVSIWRYIVVTLLSYAVVVIAAFQLILLEIIPFVSLIIVTMVLFAGTAFASKTVLSCNWRQAWMIGGTATAVDMVASMLYNLFML